MIKFATGRHVRTALALVMALQQIVSPAFSQTTDEDSCDVFSDTCPFSFDKVCDDDETLCPGQDCFDCDPCKEFLGDCDACIANGCVWCPGDAYCTSVPLTLTFEDLILSCKAEDWLDTCPPPNTDNFFSDPIYDANKWAYDLINVVPVWESGITGEGVHVRVVDDGIDAAHPEFSSNDRINVAASCEDYLPTDMDNDTHGTGVASIIGASGNNGNCAVGIAPDVTFSSCKIPNGPDTEFIDASFAAVDISSNSWNFDACHKTTQGRHRHLQECIFNDSTVCETCDSFASSTLSEECMTAVIRHCLKNYEDDVMACAEYLDLFVDCTYNSLDQSHQEALTRAITTGRDGKGVIFVFAAGNEFNIGEPINGEGWLNTRFTISVGAVGRYGLHASYSSTGAPLFVTAPGGDREFLTNNLVARAGTGGCFDIDVGTSYAAPVVSGVVALMLQANPNLGWRDVQGILATTSRKVDPTEDSWTTNAASLSHSYKYGFGLVDASAAVNASKTWKNYRPEQQIMMESGPIKVAITDDASTTATSTLTVSQPDGGFISESVVVYLDIDHGTRGDLTIVLTSPGGTESILHPGHRPENTQLLQGERWKLMTVRSWGEDPNGEWKLSIVDESPGDLSTCVDTPGWSFQGEVGTCSVFGSFEAKVCQDGVVLDPDLAAAYVDSNGVSAAEACCVCGGGEALSSSSSVNGDNGGDTLKGWRLVIYGRYTDPSFTDPPTVSPTSAGAHILNSAMVIATCIMLFVVQHG